jgi:hypothetical protein
MADRSQIEWTDATFRDWASLRAFELHEHEAAAIRTTAAGSVFDAEAPSTEETVAVIDEFHRHVDATEQALMDAYAMGISRSRLLDGKTHDDFPEVKG